MKFNQNLKIGFRMFQIAFFFFIFVHWIGCLWFLIVSIDQAWIPNFNLFDYAAVEVQYFDMTLWQKYSISFYYAALLILGADIIPVNDVQYFYGALVVLMGNIFVAFIFGNMTSLMASLSKKDNRLQD